MLIRGINRGFSVSALLKFGNFDQTELLRLDREVNPTQRGRVEAVIREIEKMNSLEVRAFWFTLCQLEEKGFYYTLPHAYLTHKERNLRLKGWLPPLDFSGKAALEEAGGELTEETQPEEQQSFSLVLTGFAVSGKLKLIKELKDMLKIGLKEAKDQLEAVEKAPITIAKGISKETHQVVADRLAALGGTTEFV